MPSSFCYEMLISLVWKRNKLVDHLEKMANENAKVLIFVGTKRVADDITKFLRQDGWPALAIHGDKEQRERDWVLGEFRAGRSPILIATDVASRGLGMFSVHIPALCHARGIQWHPSTVILLCSPFPTNPLAKPLYPRIKARPCVRPRSDAWEVSSVR